MNLDIRTTVMIAAVLALIVGASLRYALRDYPASLLPSIRLWVLGTLLLSTAWMLYGLRNAIPDFLAIVVANGLLGLGFGKQVEAVRCFVGRPANASLIYLPVAAIVVFELVFTYAEPSIRWRGVSVTAVIGAQLSCAVAALVSPGESRRRSHLLTAAAFSVLAFALFVRAAYEGLREQPMAMPFASTPMQAIVFGLAAAFPVAATLGFLLMCNDRLYQELVRHAALDALTGINNRRALDELATQAIATAQRNGANLAMLMLDADHFKHINDVYGHEGGDEALKTLTTVLLRSLGGDVMVGRVGGEEFAVVLPHADVSRARATAESLRAAVESTQFHIQGERVLLRVSIGIALMDRDDDFSSILRRADQAMYAAKRAGRNCVQGPLGDGLAQDT
ncbi:MAG TPA: GGDEF domain-containing protein [Rudaea sp.]|nr:GGDEF domain-containing protein [Rudaea sp.]